MAVLSTSTYFIGCQMEINLGNSDEPFAEAYGHLPLRSIFSRRVCSRTFLPNYKISALPFYNL